MAVFSLYKDRELKNLEIFKIDCFFMKTIEKHFSPQETHKSFLVLLPKAFQALFVKAIR